MKKIKITPLLLHLICFLGASTLQAQDENYILHDYELTISGTSTLHDWKCSVNEVNADVILNTTQERITGIDILKVNIPSTSIKSGKNAMDKKLYEALKTDRFPDISFKLSELSEFNEDGPITAQGNLTIAGVTREVTLNARGESQPWGAIVFSGSKTLDLLDYEIEPPVALFGTITTGNEIIIEFKMTLNTKANIL